MMTNSKDLQLLIAGFGGQGVLFAGKVVAYAGLIEGREVSWFPSYGPEMRGGTANCSICVSDRIIGDPLVVTPNAFIAMNGPSLERFAGDVLPEGVVVIDSSAVTGQIERGDLDICRIPAARLAEENSLPGLGNMVLIGMLFAKTGFCREETLEKALLKCLPEKKAVMKETNLKAIRLGMDYRQ